MTCGGDLYHIIIEWMCVFLAHKSWFFCGGYCFENLVTEISRENDGMIEGRALFFGAVWRRADTFGKHSHECMHARPRIMPLANKKFNFYSR